MSGAPTVLSLCVEGAKGAGKTTTIDALRRHFETRGWMVQVVAPFALANAHAKTLGYSGAVPMFAEEATHRTIVEFEASVLDTAETSMERALLDAQANRGVLLFDRGWMTFHAHVFDGACRDASWRESHWRRAVNTAPPTLFLHTAAEITRRRRVGQLDEVSGLEEAGRVEEDRAKRLRMADEHAARMIASVETHDRAWVDTTTVALVDLYRRAGFDAAEATRRASEGPSRPTLAQHTLDETGSLDAALDAMSIAGTVVVEVGVGTGAVSRRVLARSPSRLIGVEIDRSVVPDALASEIELHAVDVRTVDFVNLVAGRAATLVAAPPYDWLDDLERQLRSGVFEEALFMAPEDREVSLDGAIRCGRLDGDAFTPAAFGAHRWIRWRKPPPNARRL